MRTIRFPANSAGAASAPGDDAELPVYEFGPFRLDTEERLLFKGNAPVGLTPKALQILSLLVQQHGRVVDKRRLLQTVWGDVVVEEANLAQNVFTLRRQLSEGDAERGLAYIETVPKRGYRFVAPVTVCAAGSEVRATLVVLPLDNLCGSTDLDFLSDGFTEAIICELGALDPSRLGVIARTSSMTYKGTKKTVREVAAELNVQYVLEGSIRQSGARLMATVQLIRARDQTHIWAKSYERPLHDILRVQGEVAAAVAAEITDRLTSARAPAALPPTVDPAAYELYLKGRHYWHRRTDEGLRDAIEYYERAIALAPDFAPAHTGIAGCWVFRSMYGGHPPRETFPRAKAAALRAIELDPRQSVARAALALTLGWFEFEWEQGERELRRAIEIEPSNPLPRQWYALYLGLLMRPDEALRHIRAALRLDPFSPPAHKVHGMTLNLAGHLYSAIEAHEKGLALNPDYHINRVMLGNSLCAAGRWEEGIRHLQLACERSGFKPDLLAHLGGGYAAAGMREEARQVLCRLHEAGCYVSPYDLARIHAGLGDTDTAICCLERACEERALFVAGAPNDFVLRGLADEPRFRSCMARMRLPAR